MALEEKNVSIVIPAFSRKEELERLLFSIDMLEDVQPAEVIIVDDCSTDGTADLLDTWSKDSHRFHPSYIRLKTNSGPAKARNVGIQKATSNIIAFTDSDCIVDKYWLRELLKPLGRKNKIIGAGGKVNPLRDNIISRYSNFHRVLEPPESLLYLVTANCCFYRDEVISVGGFDEEIRQPGGEDIGLSIKLVKYGWRFGYSSTAIVYHEFRNSVIDFFKTYMRYGEGCANMSRKHLKAL